MKIEVLFFILLLIPLVYAQEEFQNYNGMDLNTKIISELKLDKGINDLSSELYLFPKTTEFQEITKKVYSDNVNEKSDYILYEWNTLPEELIFDLDYDIKSSFNIVPIKSKIPYPIKVPSEYNVYLESTDLINSGNVLIKQQADEIIKGEDDLYEVVYKIASWNKDNIEYSLETLTEEVTQDSLWVLQNKKGVCDELTVLFIAMLRSEGIPARFVSGQAYTNIIPGFGNHAWAEVYFPGKGWVPFDATYGQFGYIDATHVIMRESSDAKDPAVKYKWSPAGKNIDVKPLNISTSIISTREKLPEYVKVNINTLNNQLKSGSSLPLEIELENTQDYYLPTMLFMTKAPSEVSNNIKHVLLKPNEKKKVYWIINIPSDLNDQYLYTSKIEIVDFFGDVSETEVEYANKYDYYSIEEAKEKIYQLELENRNPESSVDIFCSPDKIKYYSYENATLNCKVTNPEEKSYSFELCFMEDCNQIEINPSEEKEFSFDLPVEVGNKEYYAQLSNSEIIKSSYFDVDVVKTPEFKIDNINYPDSIRYKDSGEIKFDLSTEFNAKNLVIKMDKQNLFDFDVYEGKENFVIPFKGKYFYNRNSKIILEYEDDNGVKYKQEQEIKINVTNVPFYIKIGNWWFLITALLIILFLFRRKFFKLKEPPKPKKKSSKI